MKRLYSELVGTVLGLGHIPVVPATWTSLATGLLYLGLALHGPGLAGPGYHTLPLSWHLALTLGFTLLGIPACRWLEDRYGEDPKQATVDEAAGMAITLFLVPLNPMTVGLGFLFFRVFDVLKPPPARALEDVPGGVGVMADDLAAGVYARAALGAAMWLFPAQLGLA